MKIIGITGVKVPDRILDMLEIGNKYSQPDILMIMSQKLPVMPMLKTSVMVGIGTTGIPHVEMSKDDFNAFAINVQLELSRYKNYCDVLIIRNCEGFMQNFCDDFFTSSRGTITNILKGGEWV